MGFFSNLCNKKELKQEVVYFSVPIIAKRMPTEEDSGCNVWIHRNENINDVYFLTRIQDDKSIWIKI